MDRARLDAAIAADPDDAEARAERARLHLAEGRPTAAIEDLKVAVLDESMTDRLLDDPGPLAALLDHPHVVLAMEADPELSRALDALQERRPADTLATADDGPHPGTAAYLKAVASSELGRHADSLRYAEEAARHLPQAADCWFTVGCALEALDRRADAVVAYRTATQVAPDFGNGWYNLALLLRRLADLRGSLDAAKEAARVDPDSSLFVYKLAEAWALDGRIPECEAELRRAIALEDAVRDALRDSEIFKAALGEDRIRALVKKPSKRS